MCGRAAYSAPCLSAAAKSLRGGGGTSAAGTNPNTASCGDEKPRSEVKAQGASTNIAPIALPREISDRPNASPGAVFHVFRRSIDAPNDPDRVECAPLIWGLLPHNGTHSSPHLLPSHPHFSPSPHYKIFNARSETVYDKPSFRGAMREGKTCILAVDGYYEWTKSQSLGDKRKQPYFVRNEDGRPLLLAGVWARVRTGRGHETIETFAILTMDARPEFAWIHPRQPVILMEGKGALEWLTRPTPQLVERLRSTPKKDSSDNAQQKSMWDKLVAHPVDKKVNDAKYQGTDCTAEIKLATKRSAGSIASFFSPGGGKKAKVDKKESAPGASSSETRPTSTLTGMPKHEKAMAEPDCNESVKEEEFWTCSKCTYVHEGAARFGYLACEICGSPRTDN